MNRLCFWLAAMVTVSMLTACWGYPASHETFVNQSNYWVGKSIQSLRRSSPPSRGIRELSNGNMEEEWGYKCPKFYEYDPKTNTIIGWRFVGLSEECISVAP